MENKTDKPYSLQDAERDVWVEKGIYDIRVAAELYASKATEELTERLKAAKAMMETYYSRSEERRKENEYLKKIIEDRRNLVVNMNAEIERLKESNKEWQIIAKDRTLTEYNKELLNAINSCKNGMSEYFRMHDYRGMYSLWESLLNSIEQSKP